MFRSTKLMMKMLLVAAFSLVIGTAQASQCPQGAARYIDPESGLLLTFASLDDKVLVLHKFTIGLEGEELQLDGFVVAEGEPLRPVSYVMHNCPDGDVTGTEIANCTVWQGVPYGVHPDHNVGLLPNALDGAVRQIILPDFARVLIANPVWESIKTEYEPFEVFDFKDCGDQ